MQIYCSKTRRLSIIYEHEKLKLWFDCCLAKLPENAERIRNTISSYIPEDINEFSRDVSGYLNALFENMSLIELAKTCRCTSMRYTEEPFTKINNVNISVDGDCNLRCVHCYIPSNEHNELKDLRKRVQLECMNYFKNIVRSIRLTTKGEPFMDFKNGYSYKWLMELTESDYVKNIYALSNYTRLLPEIQDDIFTHLTLCDKSIKIGASIDGFDKNTYESIRRGGHFETTIQNIKHAYDLGLLGTINYVLMPQNESSSLEVPERLKEYGINSGSIELIPYKDYPSLTYHKQTTDPDSTALSKTIFKQLRKKLVDNGYNVVVNTL